MTYCIVMDTGCDRYYKLRPPAPTPADELCQCVGTPPVKLMDALGYNPVHCLNCNLEVPLSYSHGIFHQLICEHCSIVTVGDEPDDATT